MRRRFLHLGEQCRRGQRACHPLQAGLERATIEQLDEALTPCDVDTRGRECGRDTPCAINPVGVEPLGECIFAIRDGQRIDARRRDIDLSSQRVDGDESLGRQ